jgi:NAD(P)-dependent dehydrogenase (short-subunit alcohol dehydrogenase family)
MNTVIVTGGGTGIGRACAIELAQAGWQVVIAGRRRELLDAVAAETGAHAVAADLSDEAECRALVQAAVDRFGGLDGLVLNAAASRAGAFAQLGREDWEVSLKTNVAGPADLIRASLPYLVASKGSIVAVASLAAIRASSFMSAYSASKAALALLIQSVAVEYGKKGVRANAICPGWVKTPMADKSMGVLMEARGLSLDEAYEVAAAAVPMRRASEPAEIATVVSFLLSPGASYINGAVIAVDGGASAVDVGALVYEE